MFKLHEISTVKELFRKHFNLSVGNFHDPIVSLAMEKLTIDLVAFDDKMHELHGDYENEGLSLSQLITTKYGSEANELIDALK